MGLGRSLPYCSKFLTTVIIVFLKFLKISYNFEISRNRVRGIGHEQTIVPQVQEIGGEVSVG